MDLPPLQVATSLDWRVFGNIGQKLGDMKREKRSGPAQKRRRKPDRSPNTPKMARTRKKGRFLLFCKKFMIFLKISFRIGRLSFGTRSELVRNSFGTRSELVRNSFGTCSELVRAPFGQHFRRLGLF